MLTTNTHPGLGIGVYDMAEVARYTRLPASTVRSWFKGERKVLASDIAPVDGDFAVSFYDMVDALVAGELRRKGVKMRVVRRAYDVLGRELGTAHPFCHHVIYTDGQRVFIDTLDQIDERGLREAVTGQHFFDHVRRCLEKMDYSDVTNRVERWRIHQGVVIDPAVSLGKPVIAGRGVTTFVLANQYDANNRDADLVADLYGVSPQDVLRAVDFEDQYGVRRPAA